MEPTRHEILEERGNRDAFHALIMVSVLFALFLVALIVAAWNTRIAFLPLMPKPPAPAKALLFIFPRPSTAGERSTIDASAQRSEVCLARELTSPGAPVSAGPTCGPVPPVHGARSSMTRESNTAAQTSAHAAGPQKISRDV